ncbi:MAG: alanine racemase [Bacteroidales bacterium]|nr:alanine racemase [Bacteroidales bacterium]
MEKKRYERPVIKRLETGVPAKFGRPQKPEIMSDIDGVSVESLVNQFGSPLYVYSEKQIRDKYRKAYKAFSTRYPKVQFAWSYKTNYLGAICNVFHQEGSWAEVVSGFEYDKARALGVEGSKIIFNGPDKSVEDLEKAIKNDSPIHIDHLDELYTLIELSGKAGKKPSVAIRINMDTGIYPRWDRFGFNYENGQAWDALNKIMHSGKLELIGLHTHIGTFMLSTEAYRVAAIKMADLARGLKDKFNHKIKYIDMGGGFATANTLKGSYLPGDDITPSIEDFAEAITSALVNAHFSTDELPVLVLESGRALIDEAGYMIGTVLANKRLATGQRATIADIGVNLLFTSFWYEHKVKPAQEVTQFTEPSKIYGPLCMNIDIMRDNIELPLLNKGDRFVVHHTGAYNNTQWLQFITLRPNVVMIDENGQPHLIREKESLEDIKKLEQIPEHLRNFEL